jgi:hypothetical protein
MALQAAAGALHELPQQSIDAKLEPAGSLRVDLPPDVVLHHDQQSMDDPRAEIMEATRLLMQQRQAQQQQQRYAAAPHNDQRGQQQQQHHQQQQPAHGGYLQKLPPPDLDYQAQLRSQQYHEAQAQHRAAVLSPSGAARGPGWDPRSSASHQRLQMDLSGRQEQQHPAQPMYGPPQQQQAQQQLAAQQRELELRMQSHAAATQRGAEAEAYHRTQAVAYHAQPPPQQAPQQQAQARRSLYTPSAETCVLPPMELPSPVDRLEHLDGGSHAAAKGLRSPHGLDLGAAPQSSAGRQPLPAQQPQGQQPQGAGQPQPYRSSMKSHQSEPDMQHHVPGPLLSPSMQRAAALAHQQRLAAEAQQLQQHLQHQQQPCHPGDLSSPGSMGRPSPSAAAAAAAMASLAANGSGHSLTPKAAGDRVGACLPLLPLCLPLLRRPAGLLELPRAEPASCIAMTDQ